MSTPTNNLTHQLPHYAETRLREFAYRIDRVTLPDDHVEGFAMPLEVNPNVVTDGLTVNEEQAIVTLLGGYRGGQLGSALFTRLARILPQPICEVVPYRVNKEGVDLLVLRRPEGDHIWPGMYHTPGTAIRQSDFYPNEDGLVRPFDHALARLQNTEFGQNITQFRYAGKDARMVGRGPEFIEIFVAEVAADAKIPSNCEWVSIHDLEGDPKFIDHQLSHIRAAMRFLLDGDIQWGPLADLMGNEADPAVEAEENDREYIPGHA